MVSYLADGIGASLGDSLAMETGFIGTPTVWYLSSVSGSDSYLGVDRNKPFATLAYAISQAATGDIISVLANHNETISTTVALNKKLIIVGEGSSLGNPTASVWGGTTGSDEVITVSSNNVEIRNIKFRPKLYNNTGAFLKWTGSNGRLKGCYFEADSHDLGTKVGMTTAENMTMDSCTFISLATSFVAQPLSAFDASGVVQIFRMRDCVVSSGGYGWSSSTTAGYVQNGIVEVRIEGLSLLLGADIKLGTTVAGFVTVPVSTGGGQVRFN